MTLTSGELSALSGSFLMMTATATAKTRRLLQSQVPEVCKWNNLISPPLRDNVLMIIPPIEILPSNVSVLLAPFAEDMKIHGKTYLIIVRGINRGCEVYLHLLKYLNSSTLSERQIAFYNRNTSEERKLEILQDLKLPIRSQSKQYRCVVATVSLGVGVDVRVHNTVVLGLSENVENLLQEAGRSMRGGAAETGGDRGISFFLHKGTLGKFIVFFDDYCYYMILVSESKHCPSTSDCRDLITKPLPICQTKTLIQMFDKDVNVQLEECSCCFGCIHRHSNEGCLVCLNFIQ